jgi:predicted site-specific integrase-resolvase
VDKVYIFFKDRLTRFGFNYFENLFNKFGTKIIILDEDNFGDKKFEEELTNDLILIIYYSMRIYTNRRKNLKKLKRI